MTETRVPTPLRVLIAEDSEDDALLLVRTLRQAGYDVAFQRVDSGSALRAALSHSPWDIVLSDFSMPGFTGLDALKTVRSVDKDLPFIFVSGSMGEDTAVAAMRAGAQDYVMKGNLQRLPPAIARELQDAAVRRERTTTEGRLQATSQLLRATFASSPLAIIITDVNGRVELWNPAAESLFGWTEKEALGLVEPWVQPVAVPDVAMLRQQVTAGRRVPGRDVKRQRRDGTLIDVAVSASPIADASGAVHRVLVMAQDIRDRKRLEAQFMQAQKMEAVGHLAGGIAHDFNNLLTVITSYSDFLLEDLGADDVRREEVQQIRSAADAATALSRQLLVFSRNQVLQPQVVSINDVVSGAGKLLKRLIGASVELILALDTDAGLVEVDPGQLEQVVMNLAINARDAMPDGGKLIVETHNEMVDRGDAVPTPHVTLAVSDTGTGMDAATQARIFEPFFTTKEVGKGTGLGLSTVYSIVQQYDGYIHVYSEPGHGSTFRIHLPRVDAPTAEALAAAAPSPELLRGSEVILVVEDAAAVRSVARQVLERFGYTVLEAPDGATALHLASKLHGNIHLLVTDLVMPGMNGRDLAARFREIRPTAGVLFTSGYTEDTVVHNASLDPGAPYLQKPFTPEALARKVRETIGPARRP